MSHLERLDKATDFAQTEAIKLWLDLAIYQETGYTWQDRQEEQYD